MVAIMEFFRLDAHVPVPVRGRYTYFPSAAERERGVARARGRRFFQLLAEIEISGEASGVICSQQSSCGGYSLLLRDGKLIFAHVAADATGERLECDAPPLGKHIVGVEFTRKGRARSARGTVTLSVDGRPMVDVPVLALPTRFAPCGDALWIGCDAPRDTQAAGDALVGARVIEIVFDVSEDAVEVSRPAVTNLPVSDTTKSDPSESDSTGVGGGRRRRAAASVQD